MELEYFMGISMRLEVYALVCILLLGLVCFYKYLEVKVVIRNSPVGKLWGEGKVIKPERTALTKMLGDKLADYVFMLKSGVFVSGLLSVLSLLLNILGEIRHVLDRNFHGVIFLGSVFSLIIFLINYVTIKARTNRLSPEFFDRHLMRELSTSDELEEWEEEDTGNGQPDHEQSYRKQPISDLELEERIKIIHSETEISHRKFMSTLFFGGIIAAVSAVGVSLVVVSVLMITHF